MEEEKVVSTEEVAEQVVEEPKETTEEVVEETVVEPPKPKKSAQERIDELTRKRRDAERDAEYWKNKALEKEKPKEPEAGPKKPTLDQYDTHEDFVAAVVQFELQTARAKEASEKRKKDEEAAWTTFNERADKARVEFEDFDEVIQTPPLTDPMRSALLYSENGPEVAYYLGNHHTEAKRICALPLEMQLVELGRLESKLLLAKQTKKVTSAPKPPTPVGMAGGAKEKDPSEMDINEWMEWDRKQTLEKERLKRPWLK